MKKANTEQLQILRKRVILSIRQGGDYTGFKLLMTDPVSMMKEEQKVERNNQIERARKSMLRIIGDRILREGGEL